MYENDQDPWRVGTAGKVVQADVEHEPQPRSDFLEHFADDFYLFSIEVLGSMPVRKPGGPLISFLDGHVENFRQSPSADGNVTGFGAQASPAAGCTRLLAHKAHIPAPGLLRLSLADQALNTEDSAPLRADAFALPGSLLVLPLEFDLLVRSPKQGAAEMFGQILPPQFQIDAEVGC